MNLGSGLQQVTTGPRSLFSFFLLGQYFPWYLCCRQQCCFLDNFQRQRRSNQFASVILKVDWYGSKGPNNNRHNNDFLHAPDFCNIFHLSIFGISLTSQVPYLSPFQRLGWQHWFDNLSLLFINKDNFWSSWLLLLLLSLLLLLLLKVYFLKVCMVFLVFQLVHPVCQVLLSLDTDGIFLLTVPTKGHQWCRLQAQPLHGSTDASPLFSSLGIFQFFLVL